MATELENDPGQIAYDAYKEFSRGVSLVNGDPLPTWEDQAESRKDAWRASARAVCERYGAIYG